MTETAAPDSGAAPHRREAFRPRRGVALSSTDKGPSARSEVPKKAGTQLPETEAGAAERARHRMEMDHGLHER